MAGLTLYMPATGQMLEASFSSAYVSSSLEPRDFGKRRVERAHRYEGTVLSRNCLRYSSA